ncbi:MAG: hypothetical protein ACN4GT_02940 [Gammaproteobacteria bacterium]
MHRMTRVPLSILMTTLISIMFLGCLAQPVAAKSRSTDLADWTEGDLIPYIESQLTSHPRFKGETVVFVALDDGAPAPVTNGLVLAIRDRIVSTVADKPGISIGWHPEYDIKGRVDCTRDAAHYFIGFETTRLIDGRYRVTMRVLDVEDQSWVTGSGMTWEGRLTSAQKRAFEQSLTDEYFRGQREAPFDASQTDVLAARLAHDLSCALVRQVAGEYVIASSLTDDATLPGTIELVRNNLGGNPALLVATSKDEANAVLEGKAHHITGDLYQYWVTVNSYGENNQLPAVTASAYVRLPAVSSAKVAVDPRRPSRVTPAPEQRIKAPAATWPRAGGLLAPISVLEPRQRRACYRAGSEQWKEQLVMADYRVGRGECFLLQTRVDRDAAVFLLNYQVRHGLVRLTDSRCSNAPTRHRLSAGQPLQFPGPGDARPSASAWQGQRGVESFYAVAVTDPALAREVGAVIGKLPARCSVSARDGLTGSQLDAWLQELGTLMERGRSSVDWQAVRIEHFL